jgi:hypothetical protein
MVNIFVPVNRIFVKWSTCPAFFVIRVDKGLKVHDFVNELNTRWWRVRCTKLMGEFTPTQDFTSEEVLAKATHALVADPMRVAHGREGQNNFLEHL